MKPHRECKQIFITTLFLVNISFQPMSGRWNEMGDLINKV